MSQIIPEYHVNVAYRSIKVTKLFSGSAKAQIETSETSNVVYEYDCVCPDFYIGETKRVLDIRIRDHQTKSRNTNIYQHIETCDCYKKSAEKLAEENINNFTSKPKAISVSFSSRFKIISRAIELLEIVEKLKLFI